MTIVDDTDRRLLRALADDGRASYAELAQQVHLSPNAVADRIRRMRREGVISGFTVQLDPAALGRPLSVISDLRLRDGVERVAFARDLGRIPQVVGAMRLTGTADYQLHIVVRDPEELEGIVDLLKHEHGVASVNSRLVLRDVPLDEAHLLDLAH